ncbi:MAG: chromosome segregation protein SMC [Firmicutes bacterium]|nr:chromosome segregation protein SMC [Bacillota bacterium]
MLIKSLELQGFKSFPDKTVLSFDRGITAVVGPNGSGKSNISDAVRWVLGEQSTKSLRGAKMEDVIFNGTSGRRPQGYAEVSLSIDNADRRLPYDGDEVRITRRYYRSGESDYLINGASVRLRDINEMFMDTGLGRDGYSIISQGKIADIVSTRSEDRREVFEEAAGISRFRYRKNEAERRLQQAQDNLLRLRDILQELESRVGPLGVQAEKAKRFLELAEEKKRLEIGLWLQSMKRLSDVLRAQEEKLAVVQKQHAGAQEALAQIEAAIEAAAAETSALLAQIDEVRRAAAQNEQEAAAREGEAAVLRNDIVHHRENIRRIEDELSRSAVSGQELENALAERLEQAKNRQEEAAKQQEALADAEAQEADAAAELESAAQQEHAVREELSLFDAALSDAKTAGATAETTIGEVQNRLQTARDGQESAGRRLEQLQNEAAAAAQKAKECEQAIESQKNTVSGYELRLGSQKRRAEERRSQADQLALDAGAEQRRVKLLEELEKNFEGFAHSVKIVMQEAERGALSGIHGPVSRILQVPAQYSTAIETALGGAMQNIVCSSESDAKRSIALLKQRDAGRATFLPLTSVKGNELAERGLEDCFGFVGIASSLVSCEEQYQPVCRFLLGRIAVAEDLDSAVAIARSYGYRFRIVTLDGQVVNAGGSLTGGSLAKNAGLLNRRNEIEKSKAAAQKLLAKAAAAKDDYRRAQEAYAADEAALLAARSELAAAQEELIRAQSEQSRLNSLMDAAKSSAEQLKQEEKAAEKRLQELEHALALAEQNRQQAQQQRKETEDRLAALQSRRAELAAVQTAAAQRSAELRVMLVATQKDAEAFETAAEELRRRSGDREQREKELAQQKAEYEEKITGTQARAEVLDREAEALRRQAAGAGGQIEALMAQRLQKEQQSTQLRASQREKSAESENCGRELARLEEQKNHTQAEYDSIDRKLYEEYDLTRREAEALEIVIENTAESGRRLAELKGKIRALGSVNLSAIEEYREVSERYTFLKAQVEDAEKSRTELLTLIEKLTDEMRKIFSERFAQINRNFGETFRELFGGGDASLSLTDPDDVLGSGIQISVQPQGKIITNIDALSGGEKSLAAIALYFAIMKVSPTPFCILDEIEAALDDVNVTRFAAYLRRMSVHTQYIAITHRRGTMEEADVLYGVTMQEKGVSKLLQLRASEVEQKLGIR